MQDDYIRPEQTFSEVMTRGIGAFQTFIQGVSEFIRSSDSAVRDLDQSLRGQPSIIGETPDQTFLGVLALIHGAFQEAREQGSASAPGVIQKAREALNKINTVEPAWRSGPAMVRTTADMMRLAMRDLRGSEALIKVATGRGDLDDLETMVNWADNVNTRMTQAQTVVAQPKRSKTAPEATPAAAETTPEAAETTPAKKPRKTQKRAKKAEEPVASVAEGPAKRDTTPKQKGTPQEVAFAQAVAQELGDKKVSGWAQEFADGKISEKQWVGRLTTHCAAKNKSVDQVFERAALRLKNGK